MHDDIIPVFGLGFISSCFICFAIAIVFKDTVFVEDAEKSVKTCEQNDGVKYFRVSFNNRYLFVTCNNGGEFTLDRTQD